MALDLAKTHDWIVDELSAARSIREAMRNVIDRCAAAAPHPDWQRLRELPFDALGPLPDRIERTLRDEPPRVPLRGLWFGIFNPVYDAKATADFYISGSDRFDPDPDSIEWARRPIWCPKSRYAHSEIMAAIYSIAYHAGGLRNDAEYPLCLAYSAFAVRDLLNAANAGLLDALDNAGVAVGFDGGDFLLLGRLARNGLAPV